MLQPLFDTRPALTARLERVFFERQRVLLAPQPSR